MTLGDIDQAVAIIQKHLAEVIIKKTGVSEVIAISYLSANEFDISRTLRHIDHEHYSLTERIMRAAGNNKGEALDKIIIAVEERERLVPDFWLDFEQLGHLDPSIYCLLTVCEWLNYEEWEGFDNAIYFQHQIVTDQIKNELHLPDIALILKNAKQVHEDQYEQQREKLAREGGVGPTPEFATQWQLFEINKSKLIDALYMLVKMNIHKFP